MKNQDSKKDFELTSSKNDMPILALNSSRDCIVIVNSTEEIIFTNAAVEKLFSYKANDIQGEKFSDIFLTEVPWEQIEVITKEGMARGWEGECLMRKNEMTFPASMSFSPIFEDSGTLKGALILLRDITRGKKTFYKRVNAEKMKALGEMVSSITHDLNNPLASVVGYSELLENRLKNASNLIPKSQITEIIQVITAEARRASGIIQNLLTFIRSEEPTWKPLKVNDLLEDAIKVYNRSIDKGQVKIIKNFSVQLPAIAGDPYMLQQVFMNILINGYQAIKNHKPQGNIKIKTHRDKGFVVIEISDNGPGIPENIIDNIFEPFFTTKKPGKGTGLGLSIASGIIKNHKGTIRVENKINGGAKFKISLPITKETIESKEETQEKVVVKIINKTKDYSIEKPLSKKQKPLEHKKRPTSKPNTPKKNNEDKFKNIKVLVVDDETVICNLASKLLSHIGIEHIDIANDGSEAMKKLERYKYDLVITDIKMPVMNGLELYELVQEDDKLKNIPFIFVTGNLLCSATEEFLRRYKLPYINKPFSVTLMIKAIEDVLLKKS